jgi:L-ascorbate metabolism protein UlaG (beta-lactamase superfamily)
MLGLRWLGVAGLELTLDGQVLLVDPYLTRIPFWQQWIGTIAPRRKLVRGLVPAAHAVLVTHAHYDHLVDVPEILTFTGAQAYGSANTCQLLDCAGIPERQIQQVVPGEKIDQGVFQVEVLKAEHGWAPGFGPGALKPDLRPPLKARDLRMDACYSYLIYAAGLRLLVAAGDMQGQAPQAEILFANPTYRYASDREYLRQVQPKVIIPIHWDDFWRPLDQPLRPGFQPPRWRFPQLSPVDLTFYQQSLEAVAPQARLIVLDRLGRYAVDLNPASSRLEITLQD